MGIGDHLMALGDAWVLHQEDPEHRRVAIGQGTRVEPDEAGLEWGLNFLANQAVVDSGEDVLWVRSARGNRPYIDYVEMRRRLGNAAPPKQRNLPFRLGGYVWRTDYRAQPAPVVLKPEERAFADGLRQRHGRFVLFEPYIKSTAPPGKQWPVSCYQEVARRLSADTPVFQLTAPGRAALPGCIPIECGSFRQAMAALSGAALYVGPEGGLHHASAAVGTPAVVIFGAYISPAITGYPELHVNLASGERFCGTRGPCQHCTNAMRSITADQVIGHAQRLLAGVHP